MVPSQVSWVDVPSNVCFPHPASSLSDDLCEVLRNHDAEEVQSNVGCVRFFERAERPLVKRWWCSTCMWQ